MAEGIVEVTAGSGTKLHSWSKTVGANTVHDEFTLPGEYPLATYSILASSISVATVDDHLLAIQAGSSLNVRIRRIRVEQDASATAAATLALTVLRLTTAGSGGTSVTPRPYDTTDSAAGCTARTLNSSKGTEGVELLHPLMVLRQTVATAGAQFDDFWEWSQMPNQKPIIIPAGTANGIAIKTLNGRAGASVVIQVEVVETAF